MPNLTRGRYPERPDCWHIYYGDVHVGTIARSVGAPHQGEQWNWLWKHESGTYVRFPLAGAEMYT